MEALPTLKVSQHGRRSAVATSRSHQSDPETALREPNRSSHTAELS
jgi:hypothetical protein